MMRHLRFGLAISKATYIPTIKTSSGIATPTCNLDLEMQNLGSRTSRARLYTRTTAEGRISMEREAGQEFVNKRSNAVDALL